MADFIQDGIDLLLAWPRSGLKIRYVGRGQIIGRKIFETALEGDANNSLCPSEAFGVMLSADVFS